MTTSHGRDVSQRVSPRPVTQHPIPDRIHTTSPAGSPTTGYTSTLCSPVPTMTSTLESSLGILPANQAQETTLSTISVHDSSTGVPVSQAPPMPDQINQILIPSVAHQLPARTSVESVRVDSLASDAEIMRSVDALPFYQEHPIVPIPLGMVPLPPVHSASPARPPGSLGSSTQQVKYYLSWVSTCPGLQHGTWEECRATMESHLGFPPPHRPEFRCLQTHEKALEIWAGKVSAQQSVRFGRSPSVRVLGPPPRPSVTLEGPHCWVVYVGRIPGLYNNMYVLTRYF